MVSTDISPPPPPEDALRPASPRSEWANRAPLLSLIALIIAVGIAVNSYYQLNFMQIELSKKLAEANHLNQESHQLSQQSQEANKELQIQLAVLDSKLAESRSQQAALENLYQELARHGDDSFLAEIDQTLMLASQQLQLAGNVKTTLIALQSVDQRLQRLNRPQWLGLRKAVTQDIERLTRVPYFDVVSIALRLDNLMESVNHLPLEIDSSPELAPPHATLLQKGPWWQRLGKEMWAELKQTIRIRRLDKPDAPLLMPEQSYFLRENLRLRLLTARIALLQRDAVLFKADLEAAELLIRQHFDLQSRSVKLALALLGQLANSAVQIDLPDIHTSLDALQNIKLTRERQAL